MTAPMDPMDPQGASDSAPSPFHGASDSQALPPDLQKFTGMGDLLEEPDPEKVVKGVTQFIIDTKRARARRRAERERNALWVKGVRGVEIIRRSEDKDDVELKVPFGAYDVPPIMDRTDELLEKRVSHMISDPAVPDAEPSSESDDDRDDAEFTTRLLTIEGGESGFNNQALARRALRKASFAGSAFTYLCVDPTGGGWQPMECRATKDAKTLDDAGTIVDQKTGQARQALESELTTRYVTPDKQLTDDQSKADRQWLPKIGAETTTSENVVLIPDTCSGIADALGVVFIRPTTLGKLIDSFPAVAKLSEDDKREIVQWRPEDSKLSLGRDARDRQVRTSDAEKVPLTSPCTALILYMKSQGAYPKGAYIVCAGEKLVLHRDFHMGMVETSIRSNAQVQSSAYANGITGGTSLREECMELPFAQLRDLDDDVDDDWNGRATATKLGPADEFRGEVVMAWIEYLERFGRPHTFLPLGSIIQPDALMRRDGNAILFNPQGKPENEVIPPFPQDAKEFFDRAGQSQDSASLLEATAQGVDSSNSVSGIAKQEVIQQAHVNLTTTRANTADWQERLWRIIAQLYRVYWTIPAKLKFTGDDGAYKLKEWTRVDLGSTRNIRIARGSFQQQSSEEKQQALDTRAQQGLISPQEHERLSGSNLRARLGYQDNPYRLRIRRQIGVFRDGPSDDDQAKVQQFLTDSQHFATIQQAATQASAAQVPAPPIAGQPPIAPVPVPSPIQLPPPPVDPRPALNPFAGRLPVDAEKDIATIRWAELRSEISGTSFDRQPDWWQAFMLAEYAQAKKDSGVLTVQEQQAMQSPQAAQPGSPEANWQKVVQTVTQQAIAKAEMVASQMVEAADGIAGKGIPGAPAPLNQGVPAQPTEPVQPPEPPPTLTPDAVHANATKLRMHAMTLAHQKSTQQAEQAHAAVTDTAQRAFEAEQADAQREHDLNLASMKDQGADIPGKTPTPSSSS